MMWSKRDIKISEKNMVLNKDKVLHAEDFALQYTPNLHRLDSHSYPQIEPTKDKAIQMCRMSYSIWWCLAKELYDEIEKH